MSCSLNGYETVNVLARNGIVDPEDLRAAIERAPGRARSRRLMIHEPEHHRLLRASHSAKFLPDRPRGGRSLVRRRREHVRGARQSAAVRRVHRRDSIQPAQDVHDTASAAAVDRVPVRWRSRSSSSRSSRPRGPSRRRGLHRRPRTVRREVSVACGRFTATSV